MQFKSISWGEDTPGPMGMEQSVWRTWSIDVPDGLAVVSEVLMGLICLSMKPLDLGQRGEDVM